MTARALTIAGSDSGGGAGIQQDLKTFQALGVWGSCAVTSVTAQNSSGVQARYDLPPDVVAAQIRSVMTDIGADAAKTGMLGSAAIVEAVARAVADHSIAPLVVDPVTVASSGVALLDDDALAALRDALVPRATVLTPNAAEATALTTIDVCDLASMREAAADLHRLGASAVVITGGDLGGPESVDLFYDGEEFIELRAPRVVSGATHGTGCMFSASLAAGLARGLGVLDAVREAKAFTARGIERGVTVGKSGGAVNP